MPVTPTYPGVYLQEVPSGARPIVGVATSVGAFVDWFPRGPVNDAVLCSSWADVARTFGGLHIRSEGSYALDQFFRNGGQSAWVVRVAEGAVAATTSIKQNPTTAAGNAELDLRAAARRFSRLPTANEESPGTWGNLMRARIDPRLAVGRYDLTIWTYTVDATGRQEIQREEEHRNLSSVSTDPRYVVNVLSTDSGSDLARANVPANPNPPAPNGTVGGLIANNVTVATVAGSLPLRVAAGDDNTGDPAAADPSWITINLGTTNITSLEDAARRLQDAIRTAQPTDVTFAGAVVRVVSDPAVNSTQSVLHVLPGLGADATRRLHFSDAAGTIATALGLAGAAANVAAYQFGAQALARGQRVSVLGTNGALPSGPTLIGSEGAIPPTGMFALNQADIFNLMCIPRISKVSAENLRHVVDPATPLVVGIFNPAQLTATVSDVTDYCRRRRSMFLLDPPSNVTNLPGLKTWMTANAGFRDPNVALHWPRVVINDPLDDFRERSIGNSGTIAGLCSRIDTARGVWKAPAGTEATLRGTTKLEYRMTDAENGQLNPIGINCLRTFDLYGHVNWGGRTLHGEDARGSDYKYLPVRRLALYIEETVFRSTQWVVFELNDEPLWAQIRLSVGSFMNDLFRKGAFQGRTKQEAYFVRCDATTTTPLDQSRGIVNLVLGFAPLRPAEFLIITISQIPPKLEV
jgi:phage tail sheath protein FI